jgi:hypothetical protein
VLFANLRKVFGSEAFGETDQRRPKAPMNEGELSLDEPADQNFVRFTDGSDDPEDVMALRMRPPAPFDGLADDRLGELWRRAIR